MTPGCTNSEKSSTGGAKRANEHQNRAKGYQKLAKREPNAAQRESKDTKMEPTVSKSRHEINIKDKVAKMSRKYRQNGRRIKLKWEPFGSHFPFKICETTMRKTMPEKS